MSFMSCIEDACMVLHEDFYDPQEAFECAMRAYEMKEDPKYNAATAMELLSGSIQRLLSMTDNKTCPEEGAEFDLRKERARLFAFMDGEPQIGSRLKLVSAATGGDGNSQFLLGQKMLPDLPMDSIYWLRIAAEQGNAKALYFLGYLYLEGDVVRKDEERASALLREAAEKGLRQAQVFVAQRCYDSGEIDEAARWARMAKDAPDENIDPVDCFYDDVEKEVNEVLGLRQAAKDGDASALGKLADYFADCFNAGYGDHLCEKANKLWDEAARLGNLSAQQGKFDECYEREESDLEGMLYWYGCILKNSNFDGNKQYYLERIQEVQNLISLDKSETEKQS